MSNEHNPDNLKPEQYGASEGYRLLDEDEVDVNSVPPIVEIERWSLFGNVWYRDNYCGDCMELTYRTKLSREELAKARGLVSEPSNESKSFEEVYNVQTKRITELETALQAMQQRAEKADSDLAQAIKELSEARRRAPIDAETIKDIDEASTQKNLSKRIK